MFTIFYTRYVVTGSHYFSMGVGRVATRQSPLKKIMTSGRVASRAIYCELRFAPILYFAGLFYVVAPKDNYRGTLLTNYHAERINVAEDLPPSLSHSATTQ